VPNNDSGYVFHVVNRGARRLQLFETSGDYRALIACLREGLEKIPIRLLAYCLMPNHFHLVVWPTENGQMGRFMRQVTATHSKRWHRARGTVGTGCVYQGKYRRCAVQADTHFLIVCRYVERNALRAGLVSRAEDWPWSSAGQRFRNCELLTLHTWPVLQSSNWSEMLNEPEPHIDVVRRAVTESRPFGSKGWCEGAPGAVRPRGRPEAKATKRPRRSFSTRSGEKDLRGLF
jgi:putative transposase